jgi:hypothetical protein
MVPTEIGIALIKAFELTEPAIVRPDIRAKMEQQVSSKYALPRSIHSLAFHLMLLTLGSYLPICPLEPTYQYIRWILSTRCL